MNIGQACLVITCLILSTGQSWSQSIVVPSRYSIRPGIQQQSSGCNQFWSYSSDNNGRFGLIRISKPDLRSSALRVMLSVADRLPSKNVGSLKLTKSIEDAAVDISRGLPLIYRVDFPIQNPLPQISEIFYNNQLLCSAPKVTGSFVSTITLEYNLKTGLSQPEQPQQPQSGAYPFTEKYTTRFTTTQPPQRFTTTQPPRRVTTTQPIFAPAGNYDVNQCGVADNKMPTTTALVIRGMEAYRGQFPWLAALYYSPQNGESGFICGGNLISRMLVVTAAHCIQRKEDSIKIKAEEILFHFGKRNLQTTEPEIGHVFSAVKSVHIHPDWNYRTQNYDADISVAVLLRTIVFNKFVKPICLWTSTSSYDDLVGKKGVVAGWGVDENKIASTARPKWATISVVSTESCLRSHSSFRFLTSDRTFCAGDSLSSRTGGSGPCNGDSGGGFVVENNGRWYLRGIISAAIVDQGTGTCNPSYFSVFTDATKFTSWIQYYISNYG